MIVRDVNERFGHVLAGVRIVAIPERKLTPKVVAAPSVIE